DEEPVGFFILLSSEPLDLPDTFRLLADEFGSTVAEIIQFKLNSWKVRERLETFEILDEFYEKMNRLRDFDETMKYSLETFQTLFDAPDGSIMLYDPDTGELQVEYSTTDMDRDPIVFTLGEGAAGTALEEEEIICIPNAAESKYFESYEEKSDSVKSLACVPLFTPRRKIGVINVSDHSQQQRFSLENVPGIEILQSRVAAALENLINNKKLEKMANTDGLTDIYNRRYMNQRLPVLFEEYVQHDTPFSVILIDVDDFKDINDNYGHTTGDRVLTSFADCLVQHSRPADIVGRYGGDEFIYVMEHSGADDAILQGEHLVESLETISVESEEGEVLNPKASLGLSVASEETGKETLHDVLKQADDQLYRSKESSGVHLSYDPSIT
ncbi:MAG: diguanylate cyclase, partial [bacterium]